MSDEQNLDENPEALARDYMGEGREADEESDKKAVEFTGTQIGIQRPVVKLAAPRDGVVYTVPLKVKKLPHYGDLPDLVQATQGSACIDLYAAVDKPVLLNSEGVQALIPTGISVAVPLGFEVQIRPRSGLALKHGVTVGNSPGTIDSDYRGEIKVILTKNTIGPKLKVERGMRIAQMTVKPVLVPEIEYVDELDDTERGEGGFGSTGP